MPAVNSRPVLTFFCRPARASSPPKKSNNEKKLVALSLVPKGDHSYSLALESAPRATPEMKLACFLMAFVVYARPLRTLGLGRDVAGHGVGGPVRSFVAARAQLLWLTVFFFFFCSDARRRVPLLPTPLSHPPFPPHTLFSFPFPFIF